MSKAGVTRIGWRMQITTQPAHHPHPGSAASYDFAANAADAVGTTRTTRSSSSSSSSLSDSSSDELAGFQLSLRRQRQHYADHENLEYHASKTVVFSYDDVNRLTSASTTVASSTPYRQTYAYNSVGNFTETNPSAARPTLRRDQQCQSACRTTIAGGNVHVRQQRQRDDRRRQILRLGLP